jgi:hypothetical protein
VYGRLQVIQNIYSLMFSAQEIDVSLYTFFIGGIISAIVYRRLQIIQNIYSMMFSAQEIDVGRYIHFSTQIFQLHY